MRGRQEILELYLQDKPLADDVDVKAIARGTPGFNGAGLSVVHFQLLFPHDLSFLVYFHSLVRRQSLNVIVIRNSFPIMLGLVINTAFKMKGLHRETG